MRVNTFSNAEVRDRVWSIIHGWGVVIDLLNSTNFSIKVRFDENPNIVESYTADGKCMRSDLFPELYWTRCVPVSVVDTIVKHRSQDIWINIYPDMRYKTEEEAISHRGPTALGQPILIHHEWTEEVKILS